MPDPVVQKFALRTLTSLPSPLLRALSGGGVVYRGGRTLDPVMQFLAHAAQNPPALWTLPVAQARRAAAQAFAAVAPRPEPGVKCETIRVDGGAGQIPARVYRPPTQDPRAPVFLYLHLGGGVMGALETGHAFCTRLAKGTGAVVVSADYRLAPEHRFPAGLDDAMAAYRWLRSHADTFGAPAGHVALAGESMGATFAAAICQQLKRAGEAQPALQVLIYPMVDLVSETPSMTTYADAYPLSRQLIDWVTGFYLKPEDDPGDVRLSPLREEDLTGLAPAVLVTAGFDPLLDQGEAYARRLMAAGVPTVYRSYDNLTHAFLAFAGVAPAAEAAA
ncbi:MAG: alpha/beta hydrolase, partial [Caulobacteraceae bacterium]